MTQAAADFKLAAILQKPVTTSLLFQKMSDAIELDMQTVIKNDFKALVGLNILVAEDNDINQIVISEMLKAEQINYERILTKQFNHY